MKDAGILPSSNQANKILHRAVIYGKADAVRELLSAGVPITGESKPKGEIEMWTPSGSLLDDVARYSDGSTSGKEVMAALLENPSVRANKPDLQRALGKAASEGQVEIVRMLIAAGADPQASFQDTYNADQKPADQTFLMRAVESGVWSMIDDALSRPHDIHAVDHDGHSALAVVVWTSPPVEDIFPIVDKLIADGADKKELDRALADACDRAEWRDGLVARGADLQICKAQKK
jgi:ankyrin repeat protein